MGQFCTYCRWLYYFILPGTYDANSHFRFPKLIVKKVTWANEQGTKKSLGTQAGICAAGFIIILILQRHGKKLRAWAGQPNFKTD